MAPGWHPDTTDDLPILRAELDACRAEIARLREENGLLRVVGRDWRARYWRERGGTAWWLS